MAAKIQLYEIPLKLMPFDDAGFHLMLKVKMNNKVARLVLDTGASKTVFDKHKIPKYINHHHFEKSDHLSTGLGTNTMESHIVSVKKLMLGKLAIHDFKMVLLDLSHISDSYEQMGLPPIDGVLGGDILTIYKAVIDYEQLTLTVKSNI